MADEKKPEVQAQGSPATAEEKAPTVEELQKKLAEQEAKYAKLKAAADEAMADTSKHKKEAKDWADKYKATLDENARAKLEQEESMRALNEQLATYKAKDRVNTYTEKLVAAGYDADTAKSMAATLPEGIGDDFFERQKAFLDTKTQSIKSQMLNEQPGLSKGVPPQGDPNEADRKRILGYMMGK